MKNSLSVSFVTLFVFGAFLAGCSSNTDTGGSHATPPPVTTPGVGSTFIRFHQQYDTLGHALPSLAWYDTVVVIASGISYQGKTNVVAFRIGSQSTSDLVFYRDYESNGDVSSYVDGRGNPGKRSGWETIPVASKGSTSFTTYDSSGNTSSDDYTYTGQQSISEAGATFDASVCDYRPVATVVGDAIDDVIAYYFAPTLGFFIKTVDYYRDFPGVMFATSDVVSYTLK